MAVPADEFKDVMSRVAATVTVVTAQSDAGPVGLTVSAFMSVSADPPIIIVCLDKSTGSLQSMLDADGYTVNIMPEGSNDEAMLFATQGADKFGTTAWTAAGTPEAGPVLASALARLECVTIDRTEMGDHWVLYGEVARIDIVDATISPLVWQGRGFVRVG